MLFTGNGGGYGHIRFRGTFENTMFFHDSNVTAMTGWFVGQSPTTFGAGVGTGFGIARTTTGNISQTSGLYMLSNGRVGIGTNSPLYALDVRGGGNVSQSLSAANFFTSYQEFTSGAGSNYYFYVVPVADYVVTVCVRDQYRTNTTVAACFIVKNGLWQSTPWAVSGTPGIGMVNGNIFYYNNTGGDRFCYSSVQLSCGV
jgi:hypothetical protein